MPTSPVPHGTCDGTAWHREQDEELCSECQAAEDLIWAQTWLWRREGRSTR